jgi:hypothetical protein
LSFVDVAADLRVASPSSTSADAPVDKNHVILNGKDSTISTKNSRQQQDVLRTEAASSPEEDVVDGTVVDQPLLASAAQVNAILAKDPATVDLPILIAHAKAANNMNRGSSKDVMTMLAFGFLANMTRIAPMLGTDPQLSVIERAPERRHSSCARLDPARSGDALVD